MNRCCRIEKKYSVRQQFFSAGNYRTYEYDSANRQTAVNLFAADGSQTLRTEYAYDPAGNLTVMKDYRYTEAGGLLYRYTQRQYDLSLIHI